MILRFALRIGHALERRSEEQLSAASTCFSGMLKMRRGTARHHLLRLVPAACSPVIDENAQCSCAPMASWINTCRHDGGIHPARYRRRPRGHRPPARVCLAISASRNCVHRPVAPARPHDLAHEIRESTPCAVRRMNATSGWNMHAVKPPALRIGDQRRKGALGRGRPKVVNPAGNVPLPRSPWLIHTVIFARPACPHARQTRGEPHS